MKILLVGNGAREHIIGEKLKASSKCDELIVFANKVNPGLAALASVYHVGDLTDMDAISAFAKENQPDFAVIGPDNVIADGAVDALEQVGVKSASPSQECAQLESSKAFTRDLLNKYDIPGNPLFKVFTDEEGLMDYAEELGTIVVKADGLHGGKGVQVQGDHFDTLEAGIEFAKEAIKTDGRVVIEEKLIGQEFSLMSFVDGENVVDMPAIQDHKRAYEGDKGPNTGGMGTYSYAENLPFLKESDLSAAHEMTVRVAAAIKEELGEPFVGIMYGGFIAVKNGVRLIEYNARFGDPEAMNALTLLKSDLVDICMAQIEGALDQLTIEFEKKATVCKYVVPEGYPASPVKGEHVELGELPEGVDMYYASVSEEDGKLLMSTSRALAFVAKADTIEEAEKLAQTAVENVKGPVFFRKDIGTQELIQKRIDMMQELRG